MKLVAPPPLRLEKSNNVIAIPYVVQEEHIRQSWAVQKYDAGLIPLLPSARLAIREYRLNIRASRFPGKSGVYPCDRGRSQLHRHLRIYSYERSFTFALYLIRADIFVRVTKYEANLLPQCQLSLLLHTRSWGFLFAKGQRKRSDGIVCLLLSVKNRPGKAVAGKGNEGWCGDEWASRNDDDGKHEPSGPLIATRGDRHTDRQDKLC